MPVTTVETLERKFGSHLRRWLGITRSLRNIALYGHSNKLKPPIRSLEEEFKVMRARELLLCHEQTDPNVTKDGIQ